MKRGRKKERREGILYKPYEARRCAAADNSAATVIYYIKVEQSSPKM
jgi:hypothetical protein